MTTLAAVAHATNLIRLSKIKGEVFTGQDFAIAFVICFFAGVFLGAVAMATTGNPIHISIASATGAWLGVAGLNKITNAVLDFITRRYEKTDM